jgi:hypothetical protein
MHAVRIGARLPHCATCLTRPATGAAATSSSSAARRNRASIGEGPEKAQKPEAAGAAVDASGQQPKHVPSLKAEVRSTDRSALVVVPSLPTSLR